ncbi:hypothetical protein [Arthrobacter sp. KNU40]|uniref:hypothetical protein n=1 Tax=Arthrobacter sp. KNU40 TaxID=3447965 RepID=UPI003F5ECA5E
MTKTRVTKQRFSTIKRQLAHPGNDLERLAQAHGLKPSTIRFIRGCKDYETYLRRTRKKARDAAKPVNSLLDSNLTPEQAQAYLDLGTNLQLANDTIRRLEDTVRQKDGVIKSKDGLIKSLRTELADCDRRLTATIIESARRKRTLWARIGRSV